MIEMQYYVMLCHAMSCYVMLCHVSYLVRVWSYFSRSRRRRCMCVALPTLCPSSSSWRRTARRRSRRLRPERAPSGLSPWRRPSGAAGRRRAVWRRPCVRATRAAYASDLHAGRSGETRTRTTRELGRRRAARSRGWLEGRKERSVSNMCVYIF
jgi:hypothetical protein